ncbi:MAG TPA: hypothetical protein VLF68_00945 [Candidatus Saccharimonadales bacterium]|nr:hypothetical protein [Candidatus Saccharimonadales bacterium]
MKKFFRKTVQEIIEQDKLSQVLVLVSFLLTFFVVRLITHLQKANIIPQQQGVFHLHHLVPGIFLILISGYIGVSYLSNETLRKITAVLFGIGAALTLDEFALWLFLKDVYWSKQGRDSVDAAVIVVVLLTFALLIREVKEKKK